MLATGILWSKNGAKAFLDQYKLASLPYDNYLRVFLTGTNKAYSIKPSIVSPADFASDIDAEGITEKRSLLNRSKFYFFIKQKRMLFEKFRACLSMLIFKYSRN
jgi:glycosyl transferase family 25